MSFSSFFTGDDSKPVSRFNGRTIYEANVCVYACVGAIARCAASVPYVIKKDETIITKKDHPLRILLSTPADYSIPSWRELIRRTITLQLVSGVAYWVIRKEKGIPVGISLKSRRSIEPIFNDEDEIEGYKLRLTRSGGSIDILLPNEVIVFGDVSPYDERKQLSPAHVALSEAFQDFNMNKWNSEFFQKGFHADMMFSTDQALNTEQRQEIANGISKGAKKDGVIILPYGLKPAQAQSRRGKTESDFTDSKDSVKEAICAAFGVPPAMVGQFRYANYANSEQQVQMFWTQNILPRLTALHENVSIRLAMPLFGLTTEADLKEARLAFIDFKAVGETAKIYSEMGYSRKQIAAILGKPELAVEYEDDKKDTRKPDQADEEPGLDDTGNPPKEDGKSVLMTKARWESGYALGYSGILKSINQEWKTLMEVFYDQMRITSTRNIKHGLSPELLTFDWVDRFAKMAEPIVREMFKAGISVFLSEEEIYSKSDKSLPSFTVRKNYLSSLSHAEQDVIESSIKVFTKRCRSIGDDVLGDFNSKLIPMFFSGATSSQMQAKIDELLGDDAKDKSLSIARGISGAGYNTSRYLMFNLRGAERHKWISSEDVLVRDTHELTNGTEVTIGEKFPHTGLLYPHDPNGATKEIANCRCTTAITVFKKDRSAAPDMQAIKDAICKTGAEATVERISSSEFYKENFPKGVNLTSLSVGDLLKVEDWAAGQSTIVRATGVSPTQFIHAVDFKHVPLNSDALKDAYQTMIGEDVSEYTRAVRSLTQPELIMNPAVGEMLSASSDLGFALHQLDLAPISTMSGMSASPVGATMGLLTGETTTAALEIQEAAPLAAAAYRASWVGLGTAPGVAAAEHQSVAAALGADASLLAVRDISQEAAGELMKGELVHQGYQGATHAGYASISGYRVAYILDDAEEFWRKSVLMTVSRTGKGAFNVSTYKDQLEAIFIRGLWRVTKEVSINGTAYICVRTAREDYYFRQVLKSAGPKSCIISQEKQSHLERCADVMKNAFKYVRENITEVKGMADVESRIALYNKYIKEVA
jgi:HK97 family phage portal protein